MLNKVTIQVPIYRPQRFAVLALANGSATLRDSFVSEDTALGDAKLATQWFGVRHIVAPIRNGQVEVLV